MKRHIGYIILSIGTQITADPINANIQTIRTVWHRRASQHKAYTQKQALVRTNLTTIMQYLALIEA